MQFITLHWAEIVAIITALIAVAEAVTRVTPSEKDNTILARISAVLDAFLPNKAKADVPGNDQVFKTEARKVLRRKK